MTLYSGRQVDPWSVKPEDIDIASVAHSLSMLCRFGGHSNEFYSVAQHCVRAAQLVPKKDRLQALLHDATESFVQDLIRPVKCMLLRYKELERDIWKQFAARFRLPEEFPASVMQADEVCLKAEIRQFMNPPGRDTELASDYFARVADTDPVPRVWTPREAESMYLMTFSDAVAQYGAYLEGRTLDGELDVF